MQSPDAKSGPGGLYGTLEVLILRTLRSAGPLHGLQIAREIQQTSGDVLQIEEGALYPALHRLMRRGLIEGEWRISEKRRRARFYDITPAGSKTLRSEIKEWVKHTEAVNKVLGLT